MSCSTVSCARSYKPTDKAYRVGTVPADELLVITSEEVGDVVEGTTEHASLLRRLRRLLDRALGMTILVGVNGTERRQTYRAGLRGRGGLGGFGSLRLRHLSRLGGLRGLGRLRSLGGGSLRRRLRFGGLRLGGLRLRRLRSLRRRGLGGLSSLHLGRLSLSGLGLRRLSGLGLRSFGRLRLSTALKLGGVLILVIEITGLKVLVIFILIDLTSLKLVVIFLLVGIARLEILVLLVFFEVASGEVLRSILVVEITDGSRRNGALDSSVHLHTNNKSAPGINRAHKIHTAYVCEVPGHILGNRSGVHRGGEGDNGKNEKAVEGRHCWCGSVALMR